MSLCCGLVGLPGCGKTTVFNAITAAGAESYGGQESHRAQVPVPDERIQPLADLYSTQKLIPAVLEVVDIPGLQKGSTVEGGRGGKLLGHIKDVDALVHVVRGYADPALPPETREPDPVRDVETIDLELMVADAQTLRNKIERLSKRARHGDKIVARETADCEKVLAALEEGTPARKQNLTPTELQSVYECNLASLKPVVYVANIKTAEDAAGPAVAALQAWAEAEGGAAVVIRARDEADIAELPTADQIVFLADLGLKETSRDRLIRVAYRTLGLVDFFTAGPKEVHVWTCREGTKAPQAAGKIHSDMEQGFIRMEVIRCEDLLALGSEAAVAKAGKQRVEGKDYVVRDGDIVVIRFNK